MSEERYAIIDGSGIIYKGPSDFIKEIWIDKDKLADEMSRDKKHQGDVKLVKILEVMQ